MNFSTGFLNLLIYGSLVWCAVSAIGLSAYLVRDLLKGEVW